MKKILLLLILFPFIANAGVVYTNINDGWHKLLPGIIFEATESENPAVNDPTLPILICSAVDSAKLKPVNVKWTITVNDYSWHYTMTTNYFNSSKILPAPAGLIYKINVKGVIDSSSYKGFYGFMICKSF